MSNEAIQLHLSQGDVQPPLVAHRVPGSGVLRLGEDFQVAATNEESHSEQVRRIGFEIGWDFACHGLLLGGHVLDENVGVKEGYQAGVEHFGMQLPLPDIYTRKWLRLRLGAHRRRRVFCDDVTPAAIKSMVTHVCPVMRSRLHYQNIKEHLEGEHVWSVDRINNDMAYVMGNLMVMSKVANEAKGSMDFDELREISLYAARQKNGVLCGLTEAQWARLTSIAALAEPRDRWEEVARTPRLTVVYGYVRTEQPHAVLQMELMHALYKCGLKAVPHEWVKRLHGKKTQKLAVEFATALTMAARRRVQKAALPPEGSAARLVWAIEDAWADPCVMPAWLKLLSLLDWDACMHIRMGGRPSSAQENASFLANSATTTGGYLSAMK